MELIKLLQIKGISEATQEDIILNFLECIDEESALAIVEEYEQAEMSLTESIINEVSLGYALKKSLGGAVQRFKDIRKKQANVSTDRPIGLAGIRKQEAQKQDVVKSQERFKQAKDTAKDIVNRMLNTRYTRDNKVAKAPEVKTTQTAEPAKTQTAEPAKTQTAEPAKTQAVKPEVKTEITPAKTQTAEPAKTQAVKPAKPQAVKATKVTKAPEVKAETTQVAKPAKAPEVKTTQTAKPAKTQTAKVTKVTKAPKVKAKTVEAGNANAEDPKVKATKTAKAPKVKAEATETGNTKVAEVVKKAITKAKEEPKQEQSKTEVKKEEKQPVTAGVKEPTLSSSDREKLQKQLERLSNLPYSDKVAAKMSEIEKRLS